MSAPPVVILAAGDAVRFGADKLLAPIGGMPLLAWSLRAVLGSVRREGVVVVVGEGQHERQQLCVDAGVATTTARDARRGMRWSLHSGLEACPAAAHGAILALADDPVAIDMLDAVLDAAARAPSRPVAVRREGAAPHPVYLPRTTWPTPPSADDDAGLRALLGGDCAWLEDPGPPPVDVDEPADLTRLELLLSASR